MHLFVNDLLPFWMSFSGLVLSISHFKLNWYLAILSEDSYLQIRADLERNTQGLHDSQLLNMGHHDPLISDDKLIDKRVGFCVVHIVLSVRVLVNDNFLSVTPQVF